MAISSSMSLLDGVDWQGHIYSGRWERGGGASIPVTDKSSGETIGTLGIASAAAAAAAAKDAAAKQPAWAEVHREARAAILERAKDLLAEHRDEIARWLIRESGSAGPKASFEIDATIGKFAQIISELRTSVFEEVIVDEGGYRSVAERVPIGVVGVIGPSTFRSISVYARSFRRSRSAMPSCSNPTKKPRFRPACSSRASSSKPVCRAACCT
jgi:benzaldehyde dehydrogenase (NAD)